MVSIEKLQLNKSLKLSNKIIKMLEEDQCNTDCWIYAIVGTFFQIHLRNSTDILEKCITQKLDLNQFSIELSENLDNCEVIARNMIECLKKMDKTVLLEYLIETQPHNLLTSQTHHH